MVVRNEVREIARPDGSQPCRHLKAFGLYLERNEKQVEGFEQRTDNCLLPSILIPILFAV